MKTAEETIRELEKTIKAQEVVILKNDKLIAEQEVIYRQLMRELQNKALPWSVQTNKPSQPLHSCIIKSVDFRHFSEIKWYEPQSKLWTQKTVQAPRNRVYELGEAN